MIGSKDSRIDNIDDLLYSEFRCQIIGRKLCLATRNFSDCDTEGRKRLRSMRDRRQPNSTEEE